MKKFLIIQTAFTGDVILATPVIEKLHQFYPDAQIDFLLRKGNEGLLQGHPFLKNIIIWNKKEGKIKNLFKIISQIRSNKYDAVINLHRFASSGLITALSGAKEKTGFDKNPFSAFLNMKTKHEIGNGKHETERNLELIQHLTDSKPVKPKLYPSKTDFEFVKQFQNSFYICIAPTSVWFTKQFPREKWIELIRFAPESVKIYLLGAPSDFEICEEIRSKSNNEKVINLAGKLTFLQSTALMKNAQMNYVNDSAPMHMASAMNAAVTAVFCSTVPAFGFGPLSDNSFIVEKKEKLYCRPCGIHGYKACPQGHFRCAHDIHISQLVETYAR